MAPLFFKKNDKSPKKGKVSRHFVFIEAPLDFVAPEVMPWGEAPWWPKHCAIRFTRKTPGNLAVGTQYYVSLSKGLGLGALVEVTEYIPNREMTLTYQKGFFSGCEIIRLEERYNGTRVEFEHYLVVRDIINRLRWPIFYKKEFEHNVGLIMNALKEYVSAKYHTHLEKKFEGQ